MMKDMTDSRRLNNSLHSENPVGIIVFDETEVVEEFVSASVISDCHIPAFLACIAE